MLLALASRVSSETSELRDLKGRRWRDYGMSQLYQGTHPSLDSSVSSLSSSSPSLCPHAWLAVFEEARAIKTVWETARKAKDRCTQCKANFESTDEPAILLFDGSARHKDCMYSYSASIYKVSTRFFCAACADLEVPERERQMLLSLCGYTIEEDEEDVLDKKFLEQARSDFSPVDALSLSAAYFENTLKGIHASAVIQQHKSSNPVGCDPDKLFLNPQPYGYTLPSSNAFQGLFGQQNNNNQAQPLRSAALKKFDRAKVKVTVACSHTVQERTARLAAAAAANNGNNDNDNANNGAAPVFGGFGNNNNNNAGGINANWNNQYINNLVQNGDWK